jgi:hypothetical protein
MQFGCVPVLLPTQRVPMNYELGGVLRRANCTLDDIFYFLPEYQIQDGRVILEKLLHMALDYNIMATWRRTLRKVAEYTLFGTDTMDDALTVSLGLLMIGEPH